MHDVALEVALLAIAKKARTLDELLSTGAGLLRSASEPTSGDSTSDAAEILERWCYSFSKGDHEAFVRRLEWDGLDHPTVRAWLSRALEEEPTALPEWIEPIHAVLRDLSRSGPTAAEGVETANSAPWQERPFADLWIPFVRYAQGRLLQQFPEYQEVLAPQARDHLGLVLLRRLAQASDEAVYGWFDAFRTELRDRIATNPGTELEPSHEVYNCFIEAMFGGGFLSFFTRYASLARQICTLVRTWIASEAEFLRRLQGDLSEIQRTFFAGRPVGRISDAEAGISDRHQGGRCVHSLCFDSGLRLIYKPHDVWIEARFSQFLDWLRTEGLDPAPSSARVLPRDGFGWVEFVPQVAARDAREVKEYFRRAGSQLCLGYILNGIDLHMENVVAGPHGPMLIDLELLLQPDTATDDPVRPDETGEPPSSMQTAFLTSLRLDPRGSIYDIGGVCGLGGQLHVEGQRAWRQVNTDAMHPGRDDLRAAPEKNVLVYKNRPQMAEMFVSELQEGFSKTYRFLRERAGSILDHDGPLAFFAGVRARFIARDSNLYAMALAGILTPPFQQEGYAQGILADSINRIYASHTDRPRLWPITRFERRALEELDLPYFFLSADGRNLLCEGEEVIRDFARMSGIRVAAERIRRLSEAELEQENCRIRAALPPVPWGTTANLGIPLEPERSELQASAPLLRAAEMVAGTIREHWRPDGSSLESSYLYDGTIGLALFFAGLARITGSKADYETAVSFCGRTTDLSASAPRALREAPLGACNGLGGIIYGLAATATLLDAPPLLEQAERVAAWIDGDAVDRDLRFDIEGGLAGALLGILALHATIEESTLLEQAKLCGDRLLKTAQTREGGGLAWIGQDGAMRAGFAHGAAGIAYALARLSEATGVDRYLRAAKEALVFEQSLFDPETRNWPVRVESDSGEPPPPIVMNAWCHGSPGGALARAGIWRISQEDPIRREAEMALLTTLRADSCHLDHLCCGNMARVEALLQSGRVLQDPALVRAAGGRALIVLERALSKGSFTVPVSDRLGGPPELGFFRGLAGVGYQCLRLIRPSALPSVLVFDPPTRGRGFQEAAHE